MNFTNARQNNHSWNLGATITTEHLNRETVHNGASNMVYSVFLDSEIEVLKTIKNLNFF